MPANSADILSPQKHRWTYGKTATLRVSTRDCAMNCSRAKFSTLCARPRSSSKVGDATSSVHARICRAACCATSHPARTTEWGPIKSRGLHPVTRQPIGNFTVNAVASDARSKTKNCTEVWCSNFLAIRPGFAASLFSKTILYLAGLVLSGLLGVTASALAQTAPYVDANGWTVFTPVSGTGSCSNGSYTGTCIIYVSSSTGSDTNNGQTVSTPVQTLAKGISLLRSGYPDWLLLKRGDTWTAAPGADLFGFFPASGASATAPMVIGSYDPS